MVKQKKHQPPKRPLPNERKAAKPVTRWMHKSAKHGLIGQTYSSASESSNYVTILLGKPVLDVRHVRVRIVEVRR